MPKFRVTSPDGKTWDVNAPEGATQDDAIAYVQKQQAFAAPSWEGSSNQDDKPNPLLQAAKNVPGSAKKFGESIIHAVMNPLESAQAVADSAAGGLRNITPAPIRSAIDKLDPNPQAAERATATADALGQTYKDRYGGLDRIKKTAIEDPVGVAADLSTVLGVGGMLPGRAGSALTTASKYTNPLSVVSPIAKTAGAVGKNLLGLSTGVGPENIAQAAKAGFKGDSSFIKNLSGEASMTEILGEAKGALQQMRETRSGVYRQGIASTADDATRLDFTPIDQKLADVTRSMKVSNKWKIGKAEVKDLKELEGVIKEWRIDESLHTPIGLDGLKQRLDALYPSSPTHNQAQRAITSVRNAVKDAIVEQSPQYAKTMADYEKALNVEKEIERALSLGKKQAQDTALRKLQSLSRNNVNTNYGNRLDLAKTLESEGGANLLPGIAGQAMNSWTARGLGGQAENLATVGLAAFHNPWIGAALPLQSPKAVGASLYGLGRAAGGVGGLLGRSGMTADRARLGGLLAAQLGEVQQPDW